jgi:uncharacterized protein YjbJ (UPF0337 family)
MGGTLDQTDGRSNDEAAVLVDDKSLESDRKLDQVVGKVKEKVERVKGKLEQAVEQMKAALVSNRSGRSAKW